MSEIDINSPELYINRELSLLEFNRRVLEQSKNEELPLLERLLYLCISSSNLDEFFEVRVSGVKQKVSFGSNTTGPDKMLPHEVLAQISETAHALVDEQYNVLNQVLIPALEEEGIRFLRRDQWGSKQEDWVKRYFNTELLPVLSPLGLDPAHPFPRILNKSLNFIISLKGKDAFGRDSGMAVLQAPRSLPRLIRLPENVAEAEYDFVFLSSIIHAHADKLFPGMEITGCYQFRLTRNSDLFVDEEEIDDLLHALEGELPQRNYGDAVRLEVADNCPDHMLEYLMDRFRLSRNDVYQVNGPVNLNRLMQVQSLVERPDLRFTPFTSSVPARLRSAISIFDAISHGDILLHHPFESFTPVIDLLRQAAKDPNVLAIKQTLYRTGNNSAVVEALVEAAKAGKEVTIVVELRARFDEEANIGLATLLQEAGAHVVYGVVGYKTHAKMLMVVRREGKKIKRYVHLGTGNYHASTARLYTDYGLMTCDRVLCNDVHKLFQQLTGLGRATALKKMLQSPFTLHKSIIQYIRQEAENARNGKPARIIAKMNSLVESQTIEELYLASQAGVQIDLIVRGICRLRPGVKGVSDNIRVRSIIGRFLEHTRVFYFLNHGEEEKIYLSSADWMERNFFSRVETCFPIENEQLRERVKADIDLYLNDNVLAWELQADGQYLPVKRGNRNPRSSQLQLLENLADIC